MKIHSGIIEVAVAALLDFRKNIIVPNVSHGFFSSHEADLVVVDDKNRLTEIEIKISISDLKADFKKDKHKYPSRYVSRLIYAIPDEMIEKAIQIIPPHYGIIVVKAHESKYKNAAPMYFARWHRMVKHKKEINPLNEKSIRNLIRLGCMRIWTLKNHNNRK